MSTTDSVSLRYLTNGELRDRLVARVGIKTERYGARSDRGLRKQHVQEIASVLKVAPAEGVELTLEEYYRRAALLLASSTTRRRGISGGSVELS